MPQSRVLILYNEPVLPPDHPVADSEHEILWTVEHVQKTLLQADYKVSRLGVNHNPDLLLRGLRQAQPDVVFNLFEGTADQGENESYAAGILEWLGLPYTGCPFKCLTLARNKHLTKHLLKGAGLPTAEFFVVEEPPVPPCPLEWPVIVKPATQDASVGLDQGSVVTDQGKLEERVAYLLRTYGPPVLVEEFINGREFNVALVEAPDLRVLPLSEVLFVDQTPGYWPIITYDAKWKPGSRDYEATPPRYGADVTPKLAAKLTEISMQAFRLVGARDYARVDYRVKPSGKPYILEVNPNPDFSPTAGLSGGLTSAGMTHAQFTIELVRNALARGQKPATVRTQPAENLTVRGLKASDRGPIQRALESTNVYRPEEVAAALRQVEAALAKPDPVGYHVRVLARGDAVLGYACYGKAALTDVSYQLYNLAVARPVQRQGQGQRLLGVVEEEVRKAGGQILLAEAVSHPQGTQARQFLLRQGFRLVGDVPDYYRQAEGRLIYAKYFCE